MYSIVHSTTYQRGFPTLVASYACLVNRWIWIVWFHCRANAFRQRLHALTPPPVTPLNACLWCSFSASGTGRVYFSTSGVRRVSFSASDAGRVSFSASDMRRVSFSTSGVQRGVTACHDRIANWVEVPFCYLSESVYNGFFYVFLSLIGEHLCSQRK